jgi:hypothetical protein
MAIEALEQQPCEDCISRKAVLDKLNKLIEVERLQGTDEMGYGRERVNAYESMIFEIESKYLYPSVNPQQPCEDCINREEALNVVHKYFEHYLKLNDDICLDGLRSLPSVTPKEKTGHWMKISPADIFECSKCGQNVMTSDICAYKFCHGCGAKMVEPQESEG